MGLAERFDALKILAARRDEETSFRLASAISELLAGIPRNRFPNPRGVLEAIQRSFVTLKGYVEMLEEVPVPPIPTAPVLETLHNLLGKPTKRLHDDASTVAAPSPEPAGELGEEADASTGLPPDLGSAEDIDLLRLFVAQCNQHTEPAEELILALERNPENEEFLNGIFRIFHSIKGDAGFMRLAGIGHLAADAEALLARCRNREIPLTGRVAELLLQSIDALKEMVRNLQRVLEDREHRREGIGPVVFGPIRREMQRIVEDPALAYDRPLRLGEILVASGAITADRLREALELQGAAGARNCRSSWPRVRWFAATARRSRCFSSLPQRSAVPTRWPSF